MNRDRYGGGGRYCRSRRFPSRRHPTCGVLTASITGGETAEMSRDELRSVPHPPLRRLSRVRATRNALDWGLKWSRTAL